MGDDDYFAAAPALPSLEAFILAMIMIFGSSLVSVPPEGQISKIDMSNIGEGTIDFTLFNNSFISNNTNDATKTVSNAEKLGLSDFYTIYPMSTCSIKKTGRRLIQEKIITCSGRSMTIHDLVATLEDDLGRSGTNITLKDLNFPAKEIRESIAKLAPKYTAMGITYIIGATAAGVTIIFAVCSLLDFISSAFGISAAFLSFISFIIASGIGSSIKLSMHHIVKDHLQELNITTASSAEYLSATWSLPFSMLVALAIYIVNLDR